MQCNLLFSVNENYLKLVACVVYNRCCCVFFENFKYPTVPL